MDDPQNNQPGSGSGTDFSAFSGTYPTQSPAQTPPPPPAAPPVNEPAASPLAPAPDPAMPATFPGETTSGSQSPGVADLYAPSAPTTGADQYTQPAAPAPFDTTYTPPTPETQSPATGPQAIDNPFNVASTPATPASSNGGGSGVKRVLAIVLLIVALIGLGFLAFTLVGKFLTGNQQKTLTYWGLWENDAVIAPLIAEYEQAHPKVKIEYQRQDIKQYRERLQAQIEKGTGPDIFRYHNTWVPMLKKDLAPAGTTGYSATEFGSTFYPVAKTDLIVGNQVLGVPLMIDGLALYYNEDILRAAGINPPASWDDFRTAAQTLTVKDPSGAIITAGAALGTTGNIEHYSDIIAMMMLQNGTDLRNPTTTEAQQALTFYKLFADKPNNVWDDTLDNSITAFANRKVAMIFAPSWQVFTIRDLNPQLNFKVIPVPQLSGTVVNWASYWVEGVSSQSKGKDEAWDFLKFISSKENMVKLYSEEAKIRAFGEPYSRVDLAPLLTSDPYVGAYISQAPTAKTFFLASRTFDNGINDRMIKYIEDAINSQSQGVSPDAALKIAAQGFTQVLNNYR